MQNSFKLQTSLTPAGHQPAAISGLVQAIQSGETDMTLLGVTGSGKTFTMASVIAELSRPTLIMAPNKTLAAQLYSEMKIFFPENAVEYFVSYYDYYQPEAYVPASDTYIEKDASINEMIDQMRLAATKALLQRRDTIIVSSVSAIYGLGDPQAFLSMVLELEVDMQIEPRQVLRKLAQLQYVRNDTELKRGVYRVRGDCIDVFPADSSDLAIRCEFFGDEITALKSFDPLTGKTRQQHRRYTVFPKSHYVTPRERLLATLEDIKSELKGRVLALEQAHKLLEAQRLAQRTQYDLEMIAELGYCSGIENYSRYLSGREAGAPPPTLLEYLPSDALIMLDESHVTVPQIGAMYKGDRSRKQVLVEHGFRLPSALDNRPLKFEEFEALKTQVLYVSATPGTYEIEHSSTIVEQIVRPTGLLDPVLVIRPVAEQVDDLLSEIKQQVCLGARVLVTTLTKRMAEDLSQYLTEHAVKVRYLHSDISTLERMDIIRSLRLGEFDVLVGINLLREGLDIPEVALVAILDADKEGFLRSERSLIQTIGRAARNVQGRVILYADKITGSMQKAIDETNRRRQIQQTFNTQNGIEPRTVVKEITDFMPEASSSETSTVPITEVHDVATLSKKIRDLETEMHDCAKNLEFENAAKIRDQIHKIQETLKKI